MYKKVIVALLACSLALNIGFFSMLITSGPKKTENNYKAHLSEAARCFDEYLQTEQAEAYTYGICGMYVALTNLTEFKENTRAYKDKNYIFELYGYMVLSPETVKSRLSEVIDTLDMFARDPNDSGAVLKLSNLLNKIKRGQ